MSAAADRLITGSGPLTAIPGSAWVPFLGCLWVVANVLLVGIGITISYPLSCSFAAGILDGTILSMIAVVKASDRFQAGTTGLLSGMSLSGLRSDGSMVAKSVDKVHGFIDQVLTTLGIQVQEDLHLRIASAVLCIIWTAMFVVLASLVAQWVRSLKAEN
ncbi:MAG TPA: hypothetical protein VFA74_12995 [Terriglobales bacterium]|nr:hypothetical protein [Terriglobales bacterium]